MVDSVALVAMGNSRNDYSMLASMLGGRHAVAQETWAVNAIAGWVQHDRAFVLDSPYISPSTKEEYKWLTKHPGPVFSCHGPTDEYPGLVRFPIEEVCQKIGHRYLKTGPAFAVAYAIWLGVKELKVYGCDYTYAENPQLTETGRANVEALLMQAMGLGMEISVAPSSSLFDTNVPNHKKLYSFSEWEAYCRSQNKGTT